jgi:hypothetical protein
MRMRWMKILALGLSTAGSLMDSLGAVPGGGAIAEAFVRIFRTGRCGEIR